MPSVPGPGPADPGGDYSASQSTRRAWAAAQRYRWPVVSGLLVLAVAQLLAAGPGGLPLVVGLAMAVVVGGVLLVKGVARWRLDHLAPGTLWTGSAALEVADLRASRKLEASAPRSGFLTAFLLTYGLAPGVLVLEEERVRWRPGRLARWSGASPWEVGRGDLVAAEVGSRRSLPGPTGLWLRLWLSDRSAVSMQLVTRQGLEAALDRLGLGDRRVWPS